MIYPAANHTRVNKQAAKVVAKIEEIFLKIPICLLKIDSLVILRSYTDLAKNKEKKTGGKRFMNIIVCCKFVPNLQDMEVGADHSVDFSKAQWQISDYDLQAVEAGVRLAKETGGKLTAVSVGTSKINSPQLRKLNF